MDVLSDSQRQFLESLQGLLLAAREDERARATDGPGPQPDRSYRERSRSRSADSPRGRAVPLDSRRGPEHCRTPAELSRDVQFLMAECVSLRHRLECLHLGQTHLLNVLFVEPEFSAPFSALAQFVVDTRAQIRSLNARLDELTRVSAETAVSTSFRLDRLEAALAHLLSSTGEGPGPRA